MKKSILSRHILVEENKLGEKASVHEAPHLAATPPSHLSCPPPSTSSCPDLPVPNSKPPSKRAAVIVKNVNASVNIFFLKFGGGCHTFYLFCLFRYMHSKSHSYNDTIHSSISIRRGLSPFPHCTCAQWGKTSLWCRAENRTWACLPASRRATN